MSDLLLLNFKTYCSRDLAVWLPDKLTVNTTYLKVHVDVFFFTWALYLCTRRGIFLRICILAFHVISKLLHHYVCACEGMFHHANTYREPSESQRYIRSTSLEDWIVISGVFCLKQLLFGRGRSDQLTKREWHVIICSVLSWNKACGVF